MDYVWVWSIAGIILVILEMLTMSFFPIFLAIAAFLTAIISFAVKDPIIQIIIFAILSVLLTWFGKPILTKYFKVNKNTRSSNVSAMVGMTGVVTMEIQENSMGQAKVDGTIWSAVAQGDETLNVGCRIKVMSVQGVKLVVKSID